jgi:hypothetical protein
MSQEPPVGGAGASQESLPRVLTGELTLFEDHPPPVDALPSDPAIGAAGIEPALSCSRSACPKLIELS